MYSNTNSTEFESGLVGSVFADGKWDLGSISGWVIPKILNMYLIPPC